MDEVTLPEGRDSAKTLQQETISPEEILRLRRARAVAKCSAMMDMAALCDRIATQVEKESPGRQRGTIGQWGHLKARVARQCADAIRAERAKIVVPDA